MVETRVERFPSMGTRVELHLFGPVDDDTVWQARRAIEAVDDALTIHRPSPTAALNERLGAGEAAAIDDALLLEAVGIVDRLRAATLDLFDPAAGHAEGGWSDLEVDLAAGRVIPSRPVLLDFGGFGKGYALDRAVAALRAGGVRSALLSAGESSIAVIGQHPLGGTWPFAIPDPRDGSRTLVELALEDEALSISSTLGGAAHRAASVRPGDGVALTIPRTAVAVERSGGAAEALSTALLVATAAERERLLDGCAGHRFVFAHDEAIAFSDKQIVGRG